MCVMKELMATRHNKYADLFNYANQVKNDLDMADYKLEIVLVTDNLYYSKLYLPVKNHKKIAIYMTTKTARKNAKDILSDNITQYDYYRHHLNIINKWHNEVDTLIDELKQDTVLANHQIHVDIINNQYPNASAIMDSGLKNKLIVTVGLLTRETLMDIKSTLAHEMGHLIFCTTHPRMTRNYNMKLNKVVDKNSIRCDKVAKAQRSNVQQGQLNCDYFKSLLLGRHLQRKQEYYADRIGAELTSPKIMINQLKDLRILDYALDQKTGFSSKAKWWKNLGSLLLDHPRVNNRIKALKRLS